MVGTGGRPLYPYGTIKPKGEARNNTAYGVFKMTLRAGGLDYEFVPEPGKTFTDSGTITCDADGGPPPPAGDATPLETTIDSGPSGTVATASATFAFSSDEAGSTFRCSLDGAAPSACASPGSYEGLANGPHTFRVEATDAAGNTGGTPAERSWTVSVPPPCTIAGTGGADTLTGTPGNDVICGLEGDDRLRGSGGRDTILGGDGTDTLIGGDGSDKLYGETGADALYTRDRREGNDLADGGAGTDTCTTDRRDKKVSC